MRVLMMFGLLGNIHDYMSCVVSAIELQVSTHHLPLLGQLTVHIAQN